MRTASAVAALLASGCLAVSSGNQEGTAGGVQGTGGTTNGVLTNGGQTGGAGATGGQTGGNPVPVTLEVAPNPIDFGYLPITTTAVACTSVTNPSNLTVHVTGVSNFSDEGAFALATSDDATPPNPITYPLAIAGGASAKVCFTLTPPITQQYTGQATLVTDHPSASTPAVQLTGWAGGPQISCSPTTIDFGQTLDHSTTTIPIICTNTGTAVPGENLWFEVIVVGSGDLTAQIDTTTDPNPLAGLAPGQSVQIDVSLQPSDGGLDNATLFVDSNAGGWKELKFSFNNLENGAASCQFAISPPSLDFGNVPVGSISAPMSFSIENQGTEPCVVQGLATVTDDFRLVSTSIAPDPITGKITIPAPTQGSPSSLSVELAFSPTRRGPFLEKLVSVVLRGKGN